MKKGGGSKFYLSFETCYIHALQFSTVFTHVSIQLRTVYLRIIYTSIKIRLCVNSDLTNISYWMAANKLSLNKSKTEYMIIGSHQNLKKLNSD